MSTQLELDFSAVATGASSECSVVRSQPLAADDWSVKTAPEAGASKPRPSHLVVVYCARTTDHMAEPSRWRERDKFLSQAIARGRSLSW